MTVRINRCACGRMPVVRARSGQGDGAWVHTNVVCPGRACGAQGPEIIDQCRDEPAAIMAWNKAGGRK